MNYISKRNTAIVLLITLIFTLFIGTTSCSKKNDAIHDEEGNNQTLIDDESIENNNGSIEEEQNNSNTNEGDIIELRIDYEYFNTVVDNAVILFNKSQNKIKLIPKKYERYNPELYEQLKNKRITELLAGDGPDILVELHYMRVLDNYKAITSGIYYDLNELINKDETFNFDEYYQPVLEAGVFGYERLLLPYQFQIPGFITLKEYIEKYDVEIDEDNWTWDSLKEMAEKFLDSETAEKIDLFDSFFNSIILNNSTAHYVDYEKKSSDFNNENFLKTLKFLKDIHSIVRSSEEDGGYINSPWTYIVDETAVFGLDYDITPSSNLMNSYAGIKRKIGLEMDIVPLPAFEENRGYDFNVTTTIGIISSCNHKEEAYEFIKFLISPEIIGNTSTNQYMLHGLPVGREASEKLIEANNEAPLRGLPLSDELLKKSKNVLQNIGVSTFNDNQINSIVMTYFTKFLLDELTAEQAAKEIDKMVFLYLNE